MLLLLTRIYVPNKVINLIDSLKFVIMSLSFIEFDKLPLIKTLMDWISFPLKTPELRHYDIDHGCSFHDNLSLIIMQILILIIGFLTTWCLFRVLRSKSVWCDKFMTKSKNTIRYGLFIRIMIEAFLFFTMSSVEEFRHFDLTSVSKTVSFIIACWWLLISFVFTIVVFYKWRKLKYTENYDKIDRDVFLELFSSLRLTHAARFYIVAFIVKRWLFVITIVIFYRLSNLAKILMLITIQFSDTVTIVMIHPYQKSRLNLIDSINQIIVLFLMLCLANQHDKSSWGTTMTDMFVHVIISNSIITVVIVTFMLFVDIIIKWSRSKKTNKIIIKQNDMRVGNKSVLNEFQIEETKYNDEMDLSAIDNNKCMELFKFIYLV